MNIQIETFFILISGNQVSKFVRNTTLRLLHSWITMATTYEQTTTTTAASGPVVDIRPDPMYVRTIPGILKIVEIVSDVIAVDY